MQTNKRRPATSVRTYEGAPAFPKLTPEQQLRRLLMSCLLWEDTFYVDGVGIGELLIETARKNNFETVARLAIEARSVFNIRHAPLLLATLLPAMGKGAPVGDAITGIIQRADELSEFLALYWKDGKRPISKQAKRGLANAFIKFDRYQLAKYNRDREIKLRDVLRMVHPKPPNEILNQLWSDLNNDTLASPDTWEVSLSAGKDKKETFERLLSENKLGYLALLRNLRNMTNAQVDPELIKTAILERRGARRVLPFRYVAAARACPQMEPYLDTALHETISTMPRLEGKTIVLVDVSGSMYHVKLSSKSDLLRVDAAAALASILNAADVRLFTFSSRIVELPPRKGMAGIDAIVNAPNRNSLTLLGDAMRYVNEIPHDRLIVITDEQSHQPVPLPAAKLAYLINVAPYQNGIGYGRWVHIDGFSEQVLRFIHEYENGYADR